MRVNRLELVDLAPEVGGKVDGVEAGPELAEGGESGEDELPLRHPLPLVVRRLQQPPRLLSQPSPRAAVK